MTKHEKMRVNNLPKVESTKNKTLITRKIFSLLIWHHHTVGCIQSLQVKQPSQTDHTERNSFKLNGSHGRRNGVASMETDRTELNQSACNYQITIYHDYNKSLVSLATHSQSRLNSFQTVKTLFFHCFT